MLTLQMERKTDERKRDHRMRTDAKLDAKFLDFPGKISASAKK